MTRPKKGRKKKRGRKKVLPGEWSEFYTNISVERSTHDRLKRLKRQRKGITFDYLVVGLLGVYEDMIELMDDKQKKLDPSDLHQYILDKKANDMREERRKKETNVRSYSQYYFTPKKQN